VVPGASVSGSLARYRAIPRHPHSNKILFLTLAREIPNNDAKLLVKLRFVHKGLSGIPFFQESKGVIAIHAEDDAEMLPTQETAEESAWPPG